MSCSVHSRILIESDTGSLTADAGPEFPANGDLILNVNAKVRLSASVNGMFARLALLSGNLRLVGTTWYARPSFDGTSLNSKISASFGVPASSRVRLNTHAYPRSTPASLASSWMAFAE